jgi:D-amino peptidase
VGEAAINALVAAHYGVPIALVTGDQATADESEGVAPEAERVVVKDSVSRFAAVNLHPEKACTLVRDGAAAAVRRLSEQRPPPFTTPIELALTFLTADMAQMACWVQGVERRDARTVVLTGSEPLTLYERFVTIVTLTRALVE